MYNFRLPNNRPLTVWTFSPRRQKVLSIFYRNTLLINSIFCSARNKNLLKGVSEKNGSKEKLSLWAKGPNLLSDEDEKWLWWGYLQNRIICIFICNFSKITYEPWKPWKVVHICSIGIEITAHFFYESFANKKSSLRNRINDLYHHIIHHIIYIDLSF